jgi:hypothetical protein
MKIILPRMFNEPYYYFLKRKTQFVTGCHSQIAVKVHQEPLFLHFARVKVSEAASLVMA